MTDYDAAAHLSDDEAMRVAADLGAAASIIHSDTATSEARGFAADIASDAADKAKTPRDDN
ncbi:hypothetical protein FH609_011780 [Streptomyces sp. 3MP-14]|uniref:Uncharacterized protein n=1 Tax=Streptomyces mimosae TaxID=2586635 RepID=A0A5N6AE29_9ACTN|nr:MULTISPECIES: hypothetical protein [Streptomyces]KAB8167074.1 hypothetical protein FH607_009230 [Streptomyces mimosae]KAB8177015.1 hypothetical protein FH609_011780 [Streptomyces sp. 3MP-14]